MSLPVLSVAVGVVGPGLIGRTFISQLAQQTEALLQNLRVSLSVVAISNSKHMLLSSEALQKLDWQQQLVEKATPANLEQLGQHVASSSSSCKVIVDCSASDTVPDHYHSWMSSGCHLITPNKKGGAGALPPYQKLRALQRETGRHFMCEATVGAGLPIISTLRSLIETGDKVVRIEGILSGTLSYIFNTFKPGVPFSSVVADAAAKGFTEPDPREDLSGMDVARKVIILARECGLPLELDCLNVHSLVPAALASLTSPQDFLQQLPQYDGELASQADSAAAAGEVVRYVGRVEVEAGTASVTLARYPQDHPFAQLQGSDNMIAFTTQRYCNTPLIVRGPGAGAEVTAAGVFSDLLRVMQSAGAPT